VIRLHATLAIAHRVLAEFARDRRARLLLIVIPGVLIIFGRYLYSSAAAFDRTGVLMLGVFPAMSMCLFGSTALAHERNEGTLETVLTTPASKAALVAGYICASAVAALAQAVVTITIGYEVCKITTASPVWLMFLLTALAGIFGMSLGICISAASKSEGEAMQFLPGVIVPQLLLSGLVWPVPLMSAWVRWLSDFLPVTVLANTMTLARLHSYGGISMLDSLAAMVGIIALVLALAVRTVGIRAASD
jgi:ABC-2 type transport system permease protein